METVKLHKIQIGSSVWGGGISTVALKGTPRTIDGTPMVQLAHGAIVPADGWCATEAEAKAKAADEIEMIGRNLFHQAKQLKDAAEAMRREVSL